MAQVVSLGAGALSSTLKADTYNTILKGSISSRYQKGMQFARGKRAKKGARADLSIIDAKLLLEGALQGRNALYEANAQCCKSSCRSLNGQWVNGVYVPTRQNWNRLQAKLWNSN